jgi:hypothetical protein
MRTKMVTVLAVIPTAKALPVKTSLPVVTKTPEKPLMIGMASIYLPKFSVNRENLKLHEA